MNTTHPLIGIDLGTTNSLIAVWNDQGASLIPNVLGSYITPSAISVDDTGTVMVGAAAWERRMTHPHQTATAFKRLMGSQKHYTLGNRDFLPEELSALVLASLKADAEAHLGTPITQAVISVPAYFNDTQRKATKAAAELAGLQVTRLVSEPTAAALAYGLHQHGNETRYLVFDLGGGTFDVSIIELFEGVIEVQASTGDNFLGGEDFTTALAAHLRDTAGWPSSLSTQTQAHLNMLAERLKCALSSNPNAEVHLPTPQGEPLAFQLDEAQWENLCAPLLSRIRNPITNALRDARLNPDQLDEVVLVGGATRMPIIRRLITRMFGHFPNISLNPDHTIALGAATQAALVARDASLREVIMTDVCPYSLGIETSKRQENNDRIPGVFSPIIERNTVLPVSRSKRYIPVRDKQTAMEIDIYQGEQPWVKDNILLGKIEVPLPGTNSEEGTVEVRFTYDASGLLDVDTTVISTGHKQQLTLISNGSALSPEEIAKRRAQLAALKIHPREETPNRALMARLERLYAESLGSRRDRIADVLADFTGILEGQNPHDILRARTRLTEWLDEIEQTPFFPD